MRADARYISDYFNRFPGAAAGAAPSGDFVVVDARLGVDLVRGLQAELYATNIFDTKQLLVVDTELPDQRQAVGRPRTIGVTIRADF